MGKKSRAKKGPTTAERPSGESQALIQFVRQLIQERRFDEAMRAAIALVETDPLNPLAHAILGSMLAQMDRPLDAVRHYELCIRLGMTTDAELYRSLAVTASLARLPIHALNAARRGAKLNVSPEQQELFTSVITGSESYLAQIRGNADVDVPTAERALILIEESTRAVQAEEPERARLRATEATLVAPTWPVVWNNLAMVLFGQDEFLEAIAACEEGQEKIGKDDPSLLSSLVRLHAVTGETTQAQSALERLVVIPAETQAIAAEIAKGHAALEQDQQVYDVLHDFNGNGNEQNSLVRYLIGVAAANLGKHDEARAAWRNLAREGLVQVRAFTEMMARNEQPPTPGARYPFFSAIELVPGRTLTELLTAAQGDPHATDLVALCARLPYLTAALCESFYAQFIDPRLTVELLLQVPTAPVLAAIERFAKSRLLNEYDRLYAHLALRGSGLVDTASSASAWLGGRRRDLALPTLHLHPSEAPAPAEPVAALMREAAEAQQRDDAAGAADLYVKVLDLEPNLPDAEHNLGTAMLLSGRMEEGETHLRKSLELDPKYALARCNLASLELSRGNLLEAHALLDPLDGTVEYTLEEAIAYLRTRSDLARAEGDIDRADLLLHCILAYDHENALALERLRQSAASPAVQMIS